MARQKPSNRKNDPQPIDSAERPWLIMVYMAGDNNLSDEMVYSLQELLTVGPPKGDFIAAQFDPGGLGIAAQRYDSEVKRGDGSKLEDFRDTDFTPPETNTGAPNTLKRFIAWATRKAPDRSMNRLLILSGHGSGTTEDYLMLDQAASDALTIRELGNVLSDLRKTDKKNRRPKGRKPIDILGMDACYMSMGEVAHALNPYVEILIGSEGQTPAFGWPYSRILDAAGAGRATNHHRSPDDLARLIVEEFVAYYADYDRSSGLSADLAALDLASVKTVTDAFSKLVATLRSIAKSEWDKVLLAHYKAQTYKYDQFVDLKDLCDCLKKVFDETPPLTKRDKANRECEDVIGAIKNCVIKAGCSGSAYQYSHGLSIYFPWAVIAPEYRKLSFGKATGWLKFLTEYLNATERKDLRDGFTLPRSPTCAEKTHRFLRATREAHKGRYTGDGSKYTGDGSKYTGDGSRSVTDRERSVKNLKPVIGHAFDQRGPKP